MQAKLKQCSQCPEGKLSILWRSNPPTCRYHAQVQTAKKQISEKKKEGGIAEKDSKFYAYLWKIKPHYCRECSGELILKEGHDCRDFAHHILPKKQFPYFRWDERNIIMLCGRFGCHGKAESAISFPKMKVYGFCEQRKKELLESVGISYERKPMTFTE